MGHRHIHNPQNKMKLFALIDCDNFYVSCELLFKPALKDKPVVVLSRNDAVIVARSKKAKELNIPMGAPVFKIQNYLKKHDVITLPSNLPLYAEISKKVMNTILETFPQTIIYSIDEAFIDISNQIDKPREKIKSDFISLNEKILKWTGIPTSIGISKTKTLSKIASKISKLGDRPEQKVTILLEENEIKSALEKTEIEDVWGVGDSFSKFLREIDIKNALELANVKSNDEKFKTISKKFGTKAIRTILELNGISCIEINTTTRKSIMRSTSLKEETSDFEYISSVISTLSEECASALRRERLCAGALSIFITTNPFKENFFSEFSTIPLPYQTNSTFDIVALSLKLFESLYAPGHLYKRIGVILTELVPEDHAQTHLFITPDERKETISKLIDKINTRFGVNILHLASSIPSTPPPPHIIQINL